MIHGFVKVGPQACVVCNMPRGLEVDRAYLMGMATAHRFLHASAQGAALLAFSASMGLCPRHHVMLTELTPMRPDGRRAQ